MKVVFFGASSYVIPLLEFLNETYNLALVVTTEKNPTDEVPKFCTEHHIPFLSIEKLDEKTIFEIKKIDAPVAVLADFRLLVRQDVIDIFPKGIINIHPSLLPEYRGPTPGTTAILDGKTTTGVSLMLLDKDLDHGSILAQEKVAIEPEETSATLYPKLFKIGTKLLEKILPDYLNGKIEPKEQDHSKATYTDYLTRESGYIDLSKIEHVTENFKLEIARKVRAYYPWPAVWTKMHLNGKEKIVKLLPISRHPELDSGSTPFLLQVEGKKPMSYKDFLNGYPQAKEQLGKLGLV